jgi:hypothetical protein
MESHQLLLLLVILFPSLPLLLAVPLLLGLLIPPALAPPPTPLSLL